MLTTSGYIVNRERIEISPRMMGLVARASAGAAGGDPRALKRLSVQFRGMGAPETEVVVSGTVKSIEGDRVVLDVVAAQGENQTIRNAEAELQL